MALRASKSLKNNVGFYPASCAVFSNIGAELKNLSGTRYFSCRTIENFTVVFSTPGRNCSFGGDVMGLQKAPSPVRTH